VTALGYDWVNPRPGKEIVSVTCAGSGDTDARILLLGIAGVN